LHINDRKDAATRHEVRFESRRCVKMRVRHWRHQLWGNGAHAPTAIFHCEFLGSFQRRTNSNIRLHAVAYPVDQYAGL